MPMDGIVELSQRGHDMHRVVKRQATLATNRSQAPHTRTFSTKFLS